MSIEKWKGGRLRVFVPFGAGRQEVPGLEHAYEPLGGDYAIRSDEPLIAPLEIDGRPAVELEYELRDGALVCVAVRAVAGGPPIAAQLLRRIEPAIRNCARDLLERNVVRLFELEDGTVAGELLYERPRPGRLAHFGEVEPGIGERLNTGYPRTRLSVEHLEYVAELYREALKLQRPTGEYVADHFPDVRPATVRNWIKKARDRGFLGDAPSDRRAGEKEES